MVNGFKDKVALVTGAGSGIGRSTAIEFAKNGAKVMVTDVDANGGQETVRLIKEGGGEAIFLKINVAQASEVEVMVNQTLINYGRLDFAFNNAGVHGGRANFIEWSEEVWDQIMSVNLKGVWLCMKYEIIQMLKQGSGVIVNTSSLAGMRGFPTSAVYTASKHGVIGLTKSGAISYAKNGIRVNAVCPGPIKTPMFNKYVSQGSAKFVEEAATRVPLGRLGTPEDIAGAVVYLCSDAASFVTGQTLVVDGGWMI